MSSDILLTRRHAILDERADQLRHNIMAVAGGHPYIAARLWRAPNESDLSWSGTSHLTLNPGVTGRVNRAVCIHDAGRVAGKINQYLFAEDVSRAGIDEDWARDVTGTGVSVHDFWEDVSTQVTAAGWCWVQIDRDAPAIDPATGRPPPVAGATGSLPATASAGCCGRPRPWWTGASILRGGLSGC